METDLMHGCATRHAQAPLPQPTYSFARVPKAKRDLEGSRLQRISNREHFHEAMGEMVLLCKEAMRRKPGKRPGEAKPLSLEYLADRLDIDDPCFGYLVRTGKQVGKGKPDPNWKKGMLQGFITVTTFTNWQHSFMWDSLNSVAYECDDPEFQGSPDRIRDTDGALARELQATVHCGDILNEGIVWPRIAEISLLGGIGSGKALVQMVIEQLECMKPTPTQNYDYAVLQATDNSIPFYESLGFIRVGAVMLGGDAGRKESVINSFISCEYQTYEVKSPETLSKIASKFGVDVQDLLFLNKHILEKAKPSSKPLKKSVLMIPKKPSRKAANKKVSLDDISWHLAKENETPKEIAKLYEVKSADLVKANLSRFPELLANSRLKEGTRIKVSHFDVLDTEYKAYAHWSFPDKLFEDPEPSYMMVRKLNRRKPTDHPFEDSLKGVLCGYEKSELLLPPSPQKAASSIPPAVSAAMPPSDKRRPLTPYMAFAMDVRGKTGNLDACEVRELWNDLCPVDRFHFEEVARESKAHSSATSSSTKKLLSTSEKAKYALYNKVVRLRPDAILEHPEYTYWYVLTFIPDLKWCHLAPMYQDGVFGSDRPRVAGMPRWRLVSEDLEKEVDISSSYCIPIKSRSIRKTLDADKEEWCIVDDGTDPALLPITPRDLTRGNDYAYSGKLPTVIEPPILESPSLLAYIPESTSLTNVTIVGKSLFANDEEPEKKRGRPPKSKSQTQAPFASEPRGRYHARKRPTVQFDIPASARKAAALRTAAGLGPMDSSDCSKKNRAISLSEIDVDKCTIHCSSANGPKQHEGKVDSPLGIGQHLKIAQMLRKTPDATEYFEPIVYESRLRRKSAPASTRPSVDTSPKRIHEKIQVAPNLQKTADASEYFAPTMFESRLRGNARRTLSHASSDLSSGSCPCSPPKRSLEPEKSKSRMKKHLERNIQAFQTQDSSTTNLVDQADYFTPVVFNSRLRGRVESDCADVGPDYASKLSRSTLVRSNEPSASHQTQACTKKRLRSPPRDLGKSPVTRKSPRRVFSSTTANSSPTRRATRLGRAESSPSTAISPRSKRRKCY